jgi:hypothetical protein
VSGESGETSVCPDLHRNGRDTGTIYNLDSRALLRASAACGMDNPIETAASRVHMPATALSALAMSLFMQQITSSSQVRSNGLQEALSRVHSRCRLIQTDRFELLIIVLLADLKDAM